MPTSQLIVIPFADREEKKAPFGSLKKLLTNQYKMYMGETPFDSHLHSLTALPLMFCVLQMTKNPKCTVHVTSLSTFLSKVQ